MSRFRQALVRIAACAALLAAPGLACAAQTVVVYPLVPCQPAQGAAIQYRLQSQLMQQQLTTNLQSQIHQNVQQTQLQQQLNGAQLRSDIARGNARIHAILQQQGILELESQAAASASAPAASPAP